MYRRTGKTIKMQIKLMQYITENWDTEKRIVLTAHTNNYARDLLSVVFQVFHERVCTESYIIFGKVRIQVMSLENFYLHHGRGYKWDAAFHDHHTKEYSHRWGLF